MSTLARIQARSERVDELTAANFGPGESLWEPRCFDLAYELTDGDRLLAVCTLQWAPEQQYWILGDVCVSAHGHGYGTEIVRRVCEENPEPIWAETSNPAAMRILEKNGFTRTDECPWESDMTFYIKRR